MFRIRRAGPDDEPFLWIALALAAQTPPGEDARANPILPKYLSSWPRPGDIGVIGEVDGAPIGAAWARLFELEEKPYVHVDGRRVPEIAIGILSGHRGQGHGRALLEALAEKARPIYPGLCLIVREDNPALRLYERFGFERIPGSDRLNRAGTTSFGMVLRF